MELFFAFFTPNWINIWDEVNNGQLLATRWQQSEWRLSLSLKLYWWTARRCMLYQMEINKLLQQQIIQTWLLCNHLRRSESINLRATRLFSKFFQRRQAVVDWPRLSMKAFLLSVFLEYPSSDILKSFNLLKSQMNLKLSNILFLFPSSCLICNLRYFILFYMIHFSIDCRQWFTKNIMKGWHLKTLSLMIGKLTLD